MDRVDSLRWRLRAFWHATLSLLGVNRAPRIVAFRSLKKGPRPVREGLPPRPQWSGPPEDEVGVAVAVRTVLISQPRMFIAVTDCVAYSNGFALSVAMRSKDEIPPHQMGFGGPYKEPDRGAGIQIGVRFSDGGETSEGQTPSPALMNYYREWSEGKDPELPAGPVIVSSGGGGGGSTWNYTYFISPLPPDGPVMITCKWPARGLHAAGKSINGTAIRAAGQKSKSVWG